MAARSPAARSRGPLITKLIVLGSILVSLLAAGVIVASCRERAVLRQAQRGLEIARPEEPAGPSGGRVSSPSTSPGPTAAELELMWQQQANAAAEAGAAPTAGQGGGQTPAEEGAAGESLAAVLERAQAQVGQAAAPGAADAGAANEGGTNATPDEIANAVVKAIAAMQQQVEANQQANQPPPAEAAEAGATAAAPETPEHPYQPTFSSGAGQFATEPPIYAASAMPPPGPDDGAGRFDTERDLPAGVVYYGIGSRAQTAAAVGAGQGVSIETGGPTPVAGGVTPPVPPGVIPPTPPAEGTATSFPLGSTTFFPPASGVAVVPGVPDATRIPSNFNVGGSLVIEGAPSPTNLPGGFIGVPQVSFPPSPTSFPP
ncbi:Collagen alpha 1(I) chain precursor [Labilithrix luteola]|uniref:Collagen alpha 1(I) chain n=1 Tax=Labilithrix luteola TaxID=1391654 RepID=A0A0K1PZT6_9BACT|nr:hypothetical protein [Labilithrix luteola]AKU98664.1 Collagen alpha 1(I) chain precursor [Labilithrix luteola]